MAGYTGRRSDRTEFANVVDQLAVDLGVTDVTLFGQPRSSGEHLYDVINAGRSLYSAQTYTRLHNPDYCLFQAVAQDSTTLHVYVTDGVQSSEDFSVPSPTVNALRAWLESDHALAILVFRGQFSGRGWSESRRSWIETVTSDRRPFYAFMLGRDEATIDEAIAGLSPSLKRRGTVLNFANEPFQCEISAAGPRLKHSANPPWSWLEPRRFESLKGTAGAVAAYTCRISQSHTIEAVALRAEGRYYRWRSETRSFAGPEPLPVGAEIRADSVEIVPGGATAYVQMVIPNDATTRFGFYVITLREELGGFRPVIDSLTTNTDASPETFDRTYRFGWLVYHLARLPFGDTGRTQPFFVTVQYR